MKPTPRISMLAAPDPATLRCCARSTVASRVLAGLLLAACALPAGAVDTSGAPGVDQLLATVGKAAVPATSPLAGEIGNRIAEQLVRQVGQQLVERQQLAQTGDARSEAASTAAVNLAPAVAGTRQSGAASKGGRQDPLRPASTAAAGGSVQDGTAAAGGLRVTVVGKTRRLAIIDGQVLQSGASIGGARIRSIAPGVVKLQRDETTETLDVSAGVDKRLRPPAGAPTLPRSTRRWRQASPEHEDRQ